MGGEEHKKNYIKFSNFTNIFNNVNFLRDFNRKG